MDRATVDVYEARDKEWAAGTRLPMALAEAHRALSVGAPLDIQVPMGDYDGDEYPDDRIGHRHFSAWKPGPFTDVLVGAGFSVEAVEVEGDELRARAVRARTLPDTVGPDMRLLVCGLNPSLYAADVGVGFARPGNRFWPAALKAGVVSCDRDPVGALVNHGVGMTDLVKRATARADELDTSEYADGAARVRRLVEWLQPGAVCFVGLAGWRAVVDRSAKPGLQPEELGGRPAYVMPSTSGLNGRSTLLSLTAHLETALEVAG